MLYNKKNIKRWVGQWVVSDLIVNFNKLYDILMCVINSIDKCWKKIHNIKMLIFDVGFEY